MPENLIGRTLDEYELESLIGEGAQATVYKAYQPELERYVAVKVVTQGYRDMLTRFKQEAKTIAALRHPNIMVVHDYGEYDGYIYFVMEYVEGGTLQDRLLGEPMPWINVIGLSIPVASALQHAHERGLIHRDVKPTNILMPQEDWPLLADFGLVKVKRADGSSVMARTTPLTDSGLVVGTPAYIAPEQANNDEIDARADMYALGVILFEMVTGRLPFEYANPNRLMIAHLTETPPSPSELNPNCPPELEDVILKALQKTPDNRFPNMNAMVDALKEAIGTATLPFPTFTSSARPPALAENVHPQAGQAASLSVPQILLPTQNVTLALPDPAKKSFIIGRSSSHHKADIDLGPYGAFDAGISRKHAQLVKQGANWQIEDLDSRNGTYVNDVQVQPGTSVTLKNGDTIRCGDLPFIFLMS